MPFWIVFFFLVLSRKNLSNQTILSVSKVKRLAAWRYTTLLAKKEIAVSKFSPCSPCWIKLEFKVAFTFVQFFADKTDIGKIWFGKWELILCPYWDAFRRPNVVRSLFSVWLKRFILPLSLNRNISITEKLGTNNAERYLRLSFWQIEPIHIHCRTQL